MSSNLFQSNDRLTMEKKYKLTKRNLNYGMKFDTKKLRGRPLYSCEKVKIRTKNKSETYMKMGNISGQLLRSAVENVPSRVLIFYVFTRDIGGLDSTSAVADLSFLIPDLPSSYISSSLLVLILKKLFFSLLHIKLLHFLYKVTFLPDT